MVTAKEVSAAVAYRVQGDGHRPGVSARRSVVHVRDLPEAVYARVDDEALVVGLADGRELHVPLTWFRWLREAAPAARERVELVANGIGLHWPDLDADVFVLDLLAPEQLP